MNILVFGAGYSGRAYARRMAGKADRIAGTTRSAEKFATLRAAGMEPLPFDGTALSPELADYMRQTTHVVVSAGPGAAGDPVLGAAGDAILNGMPQLEWIGYLSTIGVYGDHGGAWVEEDTPCRPAALRSTQRIAVEQEWLALGREKALSVAVLRLSGIYGPGRNAFVNLAAGSAKRVIKPGQVFNRIHVEDIAGALDHLGEGRIGGVFNVSDDEPAPPQDVVAYAAELMGVEPPPEVPFEEAAFSPMARSFWGEVKRVSNRKLRATGFSFAYPDYRTALSRMWANGSWKGAEGDSEPGGS